MKYPPFVSSYGLSDMRRMPPLGSITMLVGLLLSVSARILLRWAWLHITLMFSIRCDHVTLTWAPLSLLRPRGPGCGGGTWAWAPPGAPAPCWPRPAPGPGPGWHSAGKVSRSGMTGVCNVWQYSGNINRWLVSTCWSVFEFVAEGSCSPHWWWEKLGLFVSISRRQSWKGLQFSPQLMPPPKGSSHIDIVSCMWPHVLSPHYPGCSWWPGCWYPPGIPVCPPSLCSHRRHSWTGTPWWCLLTPHLSHKSPSWSDVCSGHWSPTRPGGRDSASCFDFKTLHASCLHSQLRTFHQDTGTALRLWVWYP